MRKTALKLVVAITSALLAGPTLAATCQNTGNFETWLDQFKKDAAAQGISPKIIAAASPYMKF
ncbi:MAG TPA: hypothetical protein VGJ01_04385, partial [Pseudolabrys sp.]